MAFMLAFMDYTYSKFLDSRYLQAAQGRLLSYWDSDSVLMSTVHTL